MNDQFKKLYEKLSKDGIQRTKGTETKKGYDTDGYGYQWCVDRFNEVFGQEWAYSWTILNVREGAYRSGAPFFEITVQVGISVETAMPRTCVGGHVSATYSDALKGAITNGFKKTAAFWGVGSDAYRGQIDDDNEPLPDKHENIKPNDTFKERGTFSWPEEYVIKGGQYRGKMIKDLTEEQIKKYIDWANSPSAKIGEEQKELVNQMTAFLIKKGAV